MNSAAEARWALSVGRGLAAMICHTKWNSECLLYRLIADFQSRLPKDCNGSLSVRLLEHNESPFIEGDSHELPY
jgi:hypothetical protein